MTTKVREKKSFVQIFGLTITDNRRFSSIVSFCQILSVFVSSCQPPCQIYFRCRIFFDEMGLFGLTPHTFHRRKQKPTAIQREAEPLAKLQSIKSVLSLSAPYLLPTRSLPAPCFRRICPVSIPRNLIGRRRGVDTELVGRR